MKMTPMTSRKTLAVLALALCGFVVGAAYPALATPPEPFIPATPPQIAQDPLASPPQTQSEQATRQLNQMLDTYHQMGLSGDKAQIAPLIHALQARNFSVGDGIILLSLARLGAIEAVPTLDALVPSNPANYTESHKLVRATRARILAEMEATPHAQAARFFQEIGETPEQLNNAMQKNLNDERARLPKIIDPVQEKLAEEELADMIYHGRAQELLADPLISQVKFSLGSAAGLKIEMAQLSPEQQRQTLVERLAHTKFYGIKWNEAQILIDLGHEQAVEAVAAKLQVMDADSKSYASDGFNALFTVLYACHDTDQAAAILAHYQKDADLKISGQANRVVSGMGAGSPGLIVYGY